MATLRSTRGSRTTEAPRSQRFSRRQAAILERLLPQWHGGASPEIAAALAESRLFDEAMLAGATGDVAIYDAYLHRVKTLTDSYYHDLANHQAHPREYKNALTRETQALHAALHLTWNSDDLDSRADTALGRKFGTMMLSARPVPCSICTWAIGRRKPARVAVRQGREGPLHSDRHHDFERIRVVGVGWQRATRRLGDRRV